MSLKNILGTTFAAVLVTMALGCESKSGGDGTSGGLTGTSQKKEGQDAKQSDTKKTADSTRSEEHTSELQSH